VVLAERLVLCVSDRVLILENAYYSVISPEGCAAILWKDRSASEKAAEALKITANDLYKFGLVDEIIPEPMGGAHTNPAETAASLKKALLKHPCQLLKLTSTERLKLRYEKYRAFGHFLETKSPVEAEQVAIEQSSSPNNGDGELTQ
jgi:acetyl-CoA carboxylase carboxyl transferase subunit alpha